MRVDRCDFSGFKVYPSKGKTYVRGDSKVGYTLSCLRLFGGLLADEKMRKRPAGVVWRIAAGRRKTCRWRDGQ